MSHRFDDLTKALANTKSRRGVLKLMGAGTLGSLFTGIFAGGASANSRLSITLCSFSCARFGPAGYQDCVATCTECADSGQSLGFTRGNDQPFFFCCPDGTYFSRISGTCKPRFQSCLSFCEDAPSVGERLIDGSSDCLDTCRGCQSQGLQAGWNITNETTTYFCCPPGATFDETAGQCVTMVV